jgi:hypothetical protein
LAELAAVSGVGSNFKRKVPGPDPANSTEISLSFAELLVNKETCEVVITWPAIDPDTTEAALIGDEISHSGKMKHCFKASLSSGFILWLLIQPFQLSIGTEQYVAKRFYEIGSGQDEVTMVENAANLQFEALRCETARWFLNRFRSAIDDLNMTIAKSTALFLPQRDSISLINFGRLRDYKMPSGSGGYPFGWSSIACVRCCKGGIRS